MQIVIDIPEKLYDLIQDKVEFNGDLDRNDIHKIMNSIDDGIVLPKNHGRLGDLNILYDRIDKCNTGDNKGKYTPVLAIISLETKTLIESYKESVL